MKISLSKTQTRTNYNILRVAFGILLIFLSAQVQIPIKPVPITLQTSAALILALCYEKRQAMQSIVGYIALGALGAPVFSGLSAGLPVLMGTSGGYLVGMILCVYVVATMRTRFGDDNWLKLVSYSIIGSVCIFLVALPQLALFVGIENVLEVGLYPFIITGIMKALFTGATANLLKKHLPWIK